MSPLSAADSDPVKLGWMVGSPPPPDKRVAHADGSLYQFPKTRWSFANFRQLVPSVNIPSGTRKAAALPSALRDDIDKLTFTPLGQRRRMSWAQSLEANYTDAIVVLHRGSIVYERYMGVMSPSQPHMAMSVTKSFTGLLGAMLEHEGLLDPDAPVSELIPELANGAYRGATVRDVMDMRTGVRFSEDYSDPTAEVWQYVRAARVFPQPTGYRGPEGFHAFLETLKQEGPHGAGFYYKTVNTDVLGWLIHRASGRNMPELLAERIWGRLGAEHDAYMLVDGLGTPFAGGGLNATARDMARFGEMMRHSGRYNGKQIVPATVVQQIQRGASQTAFKTAGFHWLRGYSFCHQWWVSHNAHGAYLARGVHGQTIYIDPVAEVVIARFGSHPLAANANFDPTSLPAFDALARHLMQ